MDFTLSKYVIRIFNVRVVQEWVVKENGDAYGAGGYQSRFFEVFGGFGFESDSSSLWCVLVVYC